MKLTSAWIPLLAIVGLFGIACDTREPQKLGAGIAGGPFVASGPINFPVVQRGQVTISLLDGQQITGESGGSQPMSANDAGTWLMGPVFTTSLSTDGGLSLGGAANSLVTETDTATQQGLQHGHITCSSSAWSVTFTAVYSAAPDCTFDDESGASATITTRSTTTLAGACTTAHVIDWVCVGNR